ncbi:MAG TPA: SRPBCC family protein [Gemmatimonadaceae bacterium]|nr:SRPBCC family protein [Gemmatimonadaceae bacterium]
MSKVAQSLEVNSSPDSVMDYIIDITNHPAFIGPLKSVANIRGDVKKPGTTWDWVYSLAGVELAGKAETVRFVPGKEFVYKTTTGAKSTFTYRADSAGGKKTKLSLNVDYEVPTNALGKMKASVFEKLNDAEGKRVVENLKALLEE